MGYHKVEENKMTQLKQQTQAHLRVKKDKIRNGWTDASEQNQSIARLDSSTQLLPEIKQSSTFNVEDA